MLDLGTQLRDYFEATTSAIQMDEIVPLLERVAPEPKVVRPPRRPLPGWAPAAAAVVTVAFAVGGAAWLLGVTEPAIEPAVTVPGIPATMVTAPASTVPVAEAVARGSGPELRWTAVEGAPPFIQAIAWFNDAFYGLGHTLRGPVLYRSSDGTAWEPVEAFSNIAPSNASTIPSSHGFVAGADGLIVLLPSGDQTFDVATSTNGKEWNLTPIDFVGSDPAAVFPGPAAVGPTGFLVAASLEGGFDHASLIASEFGRDVADNLAFLQVAADRILFSTHDGTEYELLLSDVGLSSADLAVPAGGVRAWWSPDGVTWKPAVREGPLLAPGLGSVVPVADGFLVASETVGLWKTADGSSWEQVDATYSDGRLLDWNGLPYEYRFLGPNLRALGSSEALPVSEAFDDVHLFAMSMGRAGIIASVEGPISGSPPDGPTPATLVYSPDGIEWRRWVSDEMQETGAFVNSFAVGSDRVLALTFDRDGAGRLWVGTPEE